MGYLRKKINGNLRIHILEKKQWNIQVSYFIPGNSRQKSLHPWKFCKIMLDPLENHDQNQEPCGNSTLLFLHHSRETHFYSSFLINTWKFYGLFLPYHWTFCHICRTSRGASLFSAEFLMVK